jgi:PAS domain S-box-containing protein
MPTRVNNTNADRVLSNPRKSTAGALSERLWSRILDALPEGISVHTSSGEITWANRKLCDIYRKPLSELKGLSCCQVFHEGTASCPHEQVLAAGHAVHLVGDLHVSGETLSLTLEPLFDESNQPWGFVRVMRDVTGERQAQEQLLKAERFATLGQLFSGVAHDVGTPLNVISGYAEFLLMRKGPADQGYKELSAILDQTRRIASIFGQALDLARPAQGRMDAIDLNTVIAESLSLVGHHLRKADVTSGLTCTIPKPLIYGEAAQLKQAFFNLLVNAGQRIGAGGRLQVVIDETGEMPGFLRLVLLGTEANGIGHDFSRSLREDLANDETEAFGIGLQLTRRILAEAGARICFSEGGEQGLGIVIYLPANAATKSEH